MVEFTEEEIRKGLDEAYEKAGHNAYFGRGFEAGILFVQNKIKLLEQHQDEALRVRKNECEEVICDHPKSKRSLPLFGYPQKCRECGEIISK